VNIVTTILVSPYFTVRRTIPFVLWSLSGKIVTGKRGRR
jgi:hypothetical protein